MRLERRMAEYNGRAMMSMTSFPCIIQVDNKCFNSLLVIDSQSLYYVLYKKKGVIQAIN